MLTVRPHSDATQSLKIGVAAHICAASPGGPRFDPSQTEEDRKSIANAIWLCHSCSDLVDKDPEAYGADVLRGWKSAHEEFVIQDGGSPTLPVIEVATLDGLTLPEGPVIIKGEDIERLREHQLEIRNPSRRTMMWFRSRIQSPEPLVGWKCREKPTGSVVVCAPDRMEMIASASGGGTISVGGKSRPPLDIKIEIDTLPASRAVVVSLFSQLVPDAPCGDQLGDALEHYLKGDVQFVIREMSLTRNFLVPLKYDPAARRITSAPIETLDGKRTIVERSLWW